MSTNSSSWGPKPYTIHAENGSFEIVASGRCRWALECLMHAGPKGCTALDFPGIRLANYIWEVRLLGVDIETVYEPHNGPFPGTHGRYVLRSVVSVSQKGEAA